MRARSSPAGSTAGSGAASGSSAAADAFKHHRPDRPSATVVVSTDVVPIGSGWGMMCGGEGKFGGAEQVVITTKAGDKRALSSVLQNVFDAWMTLLGQLLPPISEY
jgi:hypothetical protein